MEHGTKMTVIYAVTHAVTSYKNCGFRKPERASAKRRTFDPWGSRFAFLPGFTNQAPLDKLCWWWMDIVAIEDRK